jgi:PKD repeat protein
MFNNIVTFANTGIAFLFVSSSILSQNIAFKEHLVDNNFEGPAGIYINDLDRNGFDDIIAAGADGNEISIWLHNGDNPITWTKEIVDENFIGAIYVYAEDVDGDSLIDLVGAGWYGHEVAWWKNLGGSNPILWEKQVIDSTFIQAHEVFVLDLDKDNNMDVIGASAQEHIVAWWRNDGDYPVNWTKQIIGTGFSGARSISAGDIDGDIDNDVVGAALLSNEIAWWRNDGGNPISWTKFSVANNFNGAHKVYLFDLDGDQDLDILGTAYTNNQIAWWRNDGGDPVVWTKIEVTNNFYGAVIAYSYDFDEDGDVDVVGSAQGSNQVAWWSNEDNNHLVWDKHQIRTAFGAVWPLHIGDMDRDTDIDVVAGANNANTINWWENSYYSADFQAEPTSGVVPLQVQFTDLSNLSQPITTWEWDFDNDGVIDSYEQTPSWTYNEDGNYSVYLKVSDGQSEDIDLKENYITTSISGIGKNIVPERIKLYQNYPNPFNPSTTIRYGLPEGSNVIIKIYNLLGIEIRELVSEFQQAGFKTTIWDGKDKNGISVDSGVYLYKFKSNNFSQTKKMLLIK